MCRLVWDWGQSHPRIVTRGRAAPYTAELHMWCCSDISPGGLLSLITILLIIILTIRSSTTQSCHIVLYSNLFADPDHYNIEICYITN